MTLRRKLQAASVTPWALGAVLLALAARRAAHVPDLVVFAAVLSAAAYVARRFARRFVVTLAWRQLERAADAEHFERAFSLLEQLVPLYRGSREASEFLRAEEGTMHCLAGDSARAAKLLASVDLRLMRSPVQRAHVLNNLAWSVALSGDPQRAIPIARESIASLDGAGAGDRTVARAGQWDLRGCQLGTLGTALVLAGDPGEGVPLLEQAFARGGTPRLQATRAYFLGEGLRELGREEEALRAFDSAHMASPDSTFGKKAANRLSEAPTYRRAARASR